MNLTNGREAELAKIVESGEGLAALQGHVKEIIEGPAFKGSPRCVHFLTYIIDQAIAGHFDTLKERNLGTQLFGRSSTYDTSDDAIVRVTASDVRKRLLQHYGSGEATHEFRISLPLGSYIPEIIRELPSRPNDTDAKKVHRDTTTASLDSDSRHLELVSSAAPAQVSVATNAPAHEAKRSKVPSKRRLLSFANLIALVNLVLFGILLYGLVWMRSSRSEAATTSLPVAPTSGLPWTVLFSSQHPTHVIASDPGIVAIQALTGSRISVSDYANRNYIPEHNTLTPEVKRICLEMLSGASVPIVDTQTTLDIAKLAQSRSSEMDVQAARSIQFSKLKTDDNFIFFGSPLSDPWFLLFDDQLDFRIDVDKKSGAEIIRNVRPAPNEQPLYIPTGKGGETGTSYAVIALVQNPDQNGQVLLLAGLSSEATLAAGKISTDLPRLSTAMRKCGISSSSPVKHFELLLSVKTMASSPSEFDVVACHILQELSAR
jgi:hypothetical protein